MGFRERRRLAALEKELRLVAKQEQKLLNAAQKAKPGGWKAGLEGKLPPKARSGLEKAFCKGFSIVFEQGRGIIEKSYKKDELMQDHSVRDFAVQVKGRRRELRRMHKSARRGSLKNLALTTVEGVGLGALGIGLPDIVLFISTLLKGVYETALSYGCSYESRYEQLLILRMMAASLSGGEDYASADEMVDRMLSGCEYAVPDEEFKAQLQKTAAAFALDMLLLKFIQGLPVVGIIGGAANPVYYQKVMKYVQLKYRKRYLQKQRSLVSAG